MEHVKKRDKKEEEQKLKYKNKQGFTLFAGDDTGLLKKVQVVYNYQTDIIGEMNLTSHIDPEASGKFKRAKNSDFVDSKIDVDDDGQPIYKELHKEVIAKPVAKFGKQVKDEGILYAHAVKPKPEAVDLSGLSKKEKKRKEEEMVADLKTVSKSGELVSYIRGNGKTVEVFDRIKEEVKWKHDYSKVLASKPRGLLTEASGSLYLVDEAGTFVQHHAKFEKSFRPQLDPQVLFTARGGNIHCMERNTHIPN